MADGARGGRDDGHAPAVATEPGRSACPPATSATTSAG